MTKERDIREMLVHINNNLHTLNFLLACLVKTQRGTLMEHYTAQLKCIEEIVNKVPQQAPTNE